MFSASKSGQYQGYQISRSVRLRLSANGYFNRTPSSASNLLKWTWSGWVKRGSLGGSQIFFSAGTNSSNHTSFIFASDKLEIQQYIGGVASFVLTESAVRRDPSAWYHIVVVYDSANATASNRVLLYVNGQQVTAFGTATYPAQNTNSFVDSNVSHLLGAWVGAAGGSFDGYLTEINFIDGQALTPSSFGAYNAYGVWSPMKYNGTYGTNGFYLNFNDNSGATATTIGKDNSGNGNNWTPNNISVTAGATYDSMLDVPTPWPDGGNGRGNYAVLNPLQKGSVITVSAGNLQFASSSGNSYCPSTIGATTGKWYCEVFMTSVSTAAIVGIVNENASLATYPGGNANGYGYFRDGQKYTNGVGSAYGNSYTDNDIIGIALDLDNGRVWFSKNGTWQASGDPAAGTNAAFTGISATNTWFFACGNSGVTTQNANFGQRPFAYTPPTGFRALNTQNLPTPTIANGAQFMAATLYTGTGANLSITNTVNNVSFQPDFVWIKSRSAATDNILINSVVGGSSWLISNKTDAEATNAAAAIQSFNSNGFTIGNGGAVNTNTATYVGWQWKEGATQGFDIVTYTGTGANRTVAHSLGVAPRMMIVKSRSAVNDWPVYHASAASAANGCAFLNATNAYATSATVWNNTAPTSSVFTVGTGSGSNANGVTFVAYLFSEVAGFSRFGSYTGNGNADGPFVFCGFRPRFVLVKRTDGADSWQVWDTARDTYNVTSANLYPNLSNAEVTDSTQGIDIVANGFKLRTSNVRLNASGGTYIFAAFAENPTKYALAR